MKWWPLTQTQHMRDVVLPEDLRIKGGISLAAAGHALYAAAQQTRYDVADHEVTVGTGRMAGVKIMQTGMRVWICTKKTLSWSPNPGGNG